MRQVLKFSMTVAVDIWDNEEGSYTSRCPALDVYSQGDTEQEALQNITEAVKLFVESCYRRGVLEQVLKECGFEPDRQIEELSVDHGTFIDVPLPLLVSQRNNAEAAAC